MTFSTLILWGLATTQEEPRLAEIRSAWAKYSPKYFQEPFEEPPLLNAPFGRGKLKAEFQEDGLNLIRFIRFLARLPDDIVLDDTLNAKAQHGAVLLSGMAQIAHQATRPSGMSDEFYSLASQGLKQGNLSRQIGARTNLPQLIFDQVWDNRENSPHVGHRRWLLNPRLAKVGVGFTEVIRVPRGDGVVVVQDQSRPYAPFGIVAWPAPGPFPIEFCPTETPWSITLDPQQYQAPEVGKVTITLTSLAKTWTFRPVKSDDFDKTKEFSVINNQGFGVPNAIIFRPPLLHKYNSGEQYTVKVEGIKTKSGEATTLEYSVKLFELTK